MAIMAIFTGKGISKDMYDIMVKEVHQPAPSGAVFHGAAFDDKGNIHVADVWASQEALDTFVSTRLMPAFQEHNVPAPEVSVFPAHNIEAYAALDKYKVT